MRKSDIELIESRKADYQRALSAAAFCLRGDRRFLGAPKMRERLEELGALGAKNPHLTKAEMADYSEDNVRLYTDGLAMASEAAAKALDRQVTEWRK
jgi:hypothetical protein